MRAHAVAPSRARSPASELAAVPALAPDVAIIHAQEADVDGNVQLWGIPGVQKEAVLAAERALVTVERIVERTRAAPRGRGDSRLGADAVALAPGGSQPSYSLGITERDNDFYRFWDEISRDREQFIEMDGRARSAGGGVSWARRSDTRPPPARSRRSSPRAGWHAPGPCSSASGVRAPPRCSRAWCTTPTLVLVYESGTIGAKPFHIPLSIGDGELGRDRRRGGVGPRDVQLLDRRRADRRRVPRRGAGRSLRQPELDGDRRLRAPRARGCRAPAAPPRSPRAAAR